MSALPAPVPGHRYQSLDPRDNGLIVTVLSVTSTAVTIQRYRKSTVSRRRFAKAYRQVSH